MKIKFTKKGVQIGNSKMKLKFSDYVLSELEVARMLTENKKSA